MRDKNKSKKATLEAIGQLSEMINLVDFAGYIGRRTKYGDRPHAAAWGHTRKYLDTYSVPISLDDVVVLFESVGCPNEVKAAEWVVLNDRYIPTQD
jgi:hypothetical protein